MAKLEPYKGDYYLWDYLPSLPAAIAFAALFLILTAMHSWRMLRSKLWFCIPFAVGGLMMIIGFIVRIVCHWNTASLILFIMQSVFLVMPPAFFAATLYMSYTRLVRSLAREDCSLIPSRLSTRIFLWADITCINVQGCGAGLLPSDTPAAAEAGQYILVAGLVLHIVVFGCFLVLCGVFHKRFGGWLSMSGQRTDVPWKTCLTMLYMCSVIIMVRNVFRTVEYLQGREGYLMANEWPIYALDFGPMVAVMVAFFVWYPGKLGDAGPEAMELGSRDGSAVQPLTGAKESGKGKSLKVLRTVMTLGLWR